MPRHESAELEVDYSERAGFLVGKSARLADWRHRREKQEDAKLFRNLKRKADRKVPEIRERLNKAARELSKRPEAKAKEQVRRHKPAYVKMRRAANMRYHRKPDVAEKRRKYLREYERLHRVKRRAQKRRSDAKPEVKAKNAKRNAAWKKANRRKKQEAGQ